MAIIECEVSRLQTQVKEIGDVAGRQIGSAAEGVVALEFMLNHLDGFTDGDRWEQGLSVPTDHFRSWFEFDIFRLVDKESGVFAYE